MNFARLALIFGLLAQSTRAGADVAAPTELDRARAALVQTRQGVGADRFGIGSWSSPLLAANQLGDPGLARVGVALPRREAECLARTAKCYVVVFLLGFDGIPESFRRGLPEPPGSVLAGDELRAWQKRTLETEPGEILEQLDQRKDAAPIVAVILDGRTRLGGGWYVDSASSGKWAQLVMDVVLPAARDALAPGTPAERTLLMGHSMGGFGAVHLGLAHPEAFHAVVAFNPAARIPLLANAALATLETRAELPDAAARLAEGSTNRFHQRIVLSMGAAFFPDPKSAHGLAPLFDPAVHPWHLSPAANAAFDRFDLIHDVAEARLPVRIYAGRMDPLIPLGELLELRAKNVAVVDTDGDHVNHLAPDLKDALESLAR